MRALILPITLVALTLAVGWLAFVYVGTPRSPLLDAGFVLAIVGCSGLFIRYLWTRVVYGSNEMSFRVEDEHAHSPTEHGGSPITRK